MHLNVYSIFCDCFTEMVEALIYRKLDKPSILGGYFCLFFVHEEINIIHKKITVLFFENLFSTKQILSSLLRFLVNKHKNFPRTDRRLMKWVH